MEATPYQFPTSEGRKSLAVRLGLFYSDDMQDWEWQVADPRRFDEWLSLYASADLSDAEKFSLMEVLIQCLNDAPVDRRSINWPGLEQRLMVNARLHRSTIEYWSCLEASGDEVCFEVTQDMRRVWNAISQ